MKNQARPFQNPQSGSVFVIILVMIGLFGALSYAMTRSTRTDSTTLTQYQADLIAAEFIEYGALVRSAIHSLKVNGCTNEQISVESPATVGLKSTNSALPLYENPDSPTDKRCHIFYPNGGGMNFVEFPKESQISFTAANTYRDTNHYWFTAVINFNSGSSGDLTLFVPHITNEVCDAINRKLGINTTSITSTTMPLSGDWGWRGATTYSTFLTIGTGGTASLNQQKSGCIKNSDTREDYQYSIGNTFFNVLINRQ